MLLFDLLTNCERHGDVTKPVEIIAEGNVITVRNTMKHQNTGIPERENLDKEKFGNLRIRVIDSIKSIFGLETSSMKNTPAHLRSLAIAGELLQKSEIGTVTFGEEKGEWVVRIKLEELKK